MDQRQPAEIRRTCRARSGLVLILRLDDGRLLAWRGDAAQRRIVLVPDPILRRQKVRELQNGFPRYRARLGAGNRNDDGCGCGARSEVFRRTSRMVRASSAIDGEGKTN